MKRIAVIFILAALFVLVLALAAARAEGDLTKQQPIEVKVQLGDEKDSLAFTPKTMEFMTGKLYKLVLFNASPQAHYFSSEGFAGAVFTRKAQVNGKDGKAVAEVKGMVREIEVYPGGTAEWWFVPVKAGEFNDLKCTIAGHADKGMVGKIVIK